jgi:hypothetical protein
MYFWCPFLDPHLNTYLYNIGARNILVLELDMSTLLTNNYVSFLQFFYDDPTMQNSQL